MAKATIGFPTHGSAYEEDPKRGKDEEDEENADETGENDEEDAEDDEEVVEDKRKESIEERLARLEGENIALRASVNARPAEKPAAPAAEPDPDWEKLMYENPKGFVDTISERIVKRVSADLGGKYTKDQGEKEFWTEFYAENDDLTSAEDKSLVRAVLNENINILGDLPVSQAKKQLADLTRKRIMHYTGKKPKTDKGKKVVVEGAGGPRAPQKVVEKDNVVTLGDLLKARRAKRLKAQTA